jgi:DNA-binding GntR family transcriptional regulator
MSRMLGVEPESPLLRIGMKLRSFSGEIVEYRISHCVLGYFRFYVSH